MKQIRELLEGKKVSDLREEMDDQKLFSLINDGEIEHEKDHTEKKLKVDAWERTDLEDHEKYLAGNEKGLEKIFLPIDIIKDSAYYLGRKSADIEIEDRQKTQKAERPVRAASAILLGYQPASKALNELPDIPESSVYAALSGVLTSYVIRGRADKLREKAAEIYLDKLEEQIGDYTIEPI